MQHIKAMRDYTGRIDHFIDEARKVKYRRVLGGIAWPHGTRPGFAVLIGEDKHQETGYSHNLVHALWELETASVSDLMAHCAGLPVTAWYADPFDRTSIVIMHQFNLDQRRQCRPALSVNRAPLLEEGNRAACFQYGVERIKARTAISRKTLILDKCPKVKGCLETVPEEAGTGEGVEDFPPLAALCFALGANDLFAYRDPLLMQREAEPVSPFRGRFERRR